MSVTHTPAPLRSQLVGCSTPTGDAEQKLQQQSGQVIRMRGADCYDKQLRLTIRTFKQ